MTYPEANPSRSQGNFTYFPVYGWRFYLLSGVWTCNLLTGRRFHLLFDVWASEFYLLSDVWVGNLLTFRPLGGRVTYFRAMTGPVVGLFTSKTLFPDVAAFTPSQTQKPQHPGFPRGPPPWY